MARPDREPLGAVSILLLDRTPADGAGSGVPLRSKQASNRFVFYREVSFIGYVALAGLAAGIAVSVCTTASATRTADPRIAEPAR